MCGRLLRFPRPRASQRRVQRVDRVSVVSGQTERHSFCEMPLSATFKAWRLRHILDKQQRADERKKLRQERSCVLFNDDGDDCREIMERAVRSEHLKYIQQHTPTCGYHRTGGLLLVAAETGRLDVLEQLYKLCSDTMDAEATKCMLHVAVTNDHLPVLAWAHLNKTSGWSSQILDLAAELGRLKIVKWLHSYRLEGCTTVAMDAAARNGRLDVVKWLHRHRTEGCTTAAMDEAAARGHLKVVRWLHKRRTEGCTKNAMDRAASAGHLRVVRWLHEHRPEGCTTAAMDNAARLGFLSIVKWLHRHRTEGCTSEAMDRAASAGRLEVVQWLHQHRHEGCTTEAMDRASANGHLEVIEWLHENRKEGCTTQAMDDALARRDLSVVQWLHENRTEGCTTEAMDRAAEEGDRRVVLWLHKYRTEGCTTDAMDAAARNGDLWMANWLHENRTEGCTTAAMDQAARSGNLAMVLWLHNHREEGCTTQAMDFAVANSHFHVVQFLHEKRSEGCTTQALQASIKRQDIQVIKYLYEARPELSQWPQLEQAATLMKLLLSKDPQDKAILDYITDYRRQHYVPLERTAAGEEKELEGRRRSQVEMIYGLTLVKFVLKHKAPQSPCEDIGSIVTQFLIRDPRQFFRAVEAADRGFVYWLAHYGGLGSSHLRWLAHRGNFDGARRMHEHMSKTSRAWTCDNHFKLLTMERGDMAYIQWHVRNCSSMQFEEVVHLAIWTGRKDVIRWIQTHYITGKPEKKSTSGGARWRREPSLTEMDIAAAENDLFTVEYIHSVEGKDAKCTTKAMDLAAANGHLEMVQWLHRYRDEGCTTDAMDVAASHGHLEVLNWLHHNRKEGYTTLAMDGAAANGHLHVVQWLHRHRRDGSGLLNISGPGSKQGEDRVARQFRDSLPSILVNVQSQRHSPLDLAAYHGHFDIVKFLHENQSNTIVAVLAMDLAAAAGHLRIVQYLDENRDEGCTDTAIYGALRHNHYEVVLYLYENRPECISWPKDEELLPFVMTMLRDPNNLVIRQILNLLRLHRELHLGSQVMDQAAFEGNTDLVRAIHELDIGGCTTKALDYASMNGNLHLVQFLHRNREEGCTTDAMNRAAEAGHLDVVTFLHENRSEGCTRNAIEQAARYGHEQVVKFLNEHRNEGCSPYAMYWATMNNHVDVVRYMVETKMPGDVSKCLQAAKTMQSESMVEVFMAIPGSYDCSQPCMSRQRARRYLNQDSMAEVIHHDEIEQVMVPERANRRFV